MRTLPFLISVALTFAGCAETGKGPSQDRPRGDASLNRVLEELGPSSPTFEDRVPEEFRTALLVPAAGAGQGTEDDEAPAPNLVVDARDNGVLFPLREKPRKFGDANELDAFLLRAFGAQKNETRPQDEQQAPDHEERHSSKPQGGHGYYVVLGSTYFFDPQPGVVYRIADPLLAHLGGAYGVVMVGDQSLCVDPDEVCDATFASYLEPVGETTRLTQRQSCGRPFSDGSAVCVTHHSFWNDFTVFARWIRHGSNIRFSSYSALPSSALRVRARIF